MPNPGDVAINKKTGAQYTWTGQAWAAGKAQVQDASMRSRMDLGLAPMVQAQQDMAAEERGGNPLDKEWGAAALENVNIPIPFTGGGGGAATEWSPFDPLARKLGGQHFQNYVQAAKSFESQLMPIMSGAAVSPSEARRQIRASLPEMADTPETLDRKARTRAMMLNGAAKARGAPLPYPDVPTWGVNTTQVPQGGNAGAPRVRKYNAQTGRIE